jgi:hypothetical protein
VAPQMVTDDTVCVGLSFLLEKLFVLSEVSLRGGTVCVDTRFFNRRRLDALGTFSPRA